MRQKNDNRGRELLLDGSFPVLKQIIMKQLRYIALLIFIITACAAYSQQMYDRCGSMIGRYENGRIYDRTGCYVGRIESGRFYDHTGWYLGCENGDRYYDRSGTLVGY